MSGRLLEVNLSTRILVGLHNWGFKNQAESHRHFGFRITNHTQSSVYSRPGVLPVICERRGGNCTNRCARKIVSRKILDKTALVGVKYFSTRKYFVSIFAACYHDKINTTEKCPFAHPLLNYAPGLVAL